MHNLYLNDVIIGYSPQEPLEYKMNYHFSSKILYHIHGKNGSGKTTLMRTICGYLSPISGKILYHNSTLKTAYYGHKIAIKQQLLVKDYLKFCTHVFENSDLIGHLIQTFDIKNFLNMPIHYLSYGQQKRVSLVGFLCCNCDVYCFDEASSGLDLFFKEIFYDYLKNLAFEKNKIVIFSDHNYPKTDNVTLINLDDYQIKNI